MHRLPLNYSLIIHSETKDMTEKERFFEVVKRSGVPLQEFYEQWEKIHELNGRTPILAKCRQERVQYYIDQDPMKEALLYYEEMMNFSNLDLVADRLANVEKWVKEGDPNRKNLLREGIRKTKEELKNKFFVPIDRSSYYYKLYFKTTTINKVKELVRNSTSLNTPNFNRAVKYTMERHLPDFLEMSIDQLKEALDNVSSEFRELDLTSSTTKERKAFCISENCSDILQKIVDSSPTNISKQKLGKLFYRYFASVVYSTFKNQN